MTTPTCHCGQPETADHTSDAHFLRRMATAYPPNSTWFARLTRIARDLEELTGRATFLRGQRDSARLLHQPTWLADPSTVPVTYYDIRHCETCETVWPCETSTALGWIEEQS